MRGMIAASINVRGGRRNCQGDKEQVASSYTTQNRIPRSTPSQATEHDRRNLIAMGTEYC